MLEVNQDKCCYCGGCVGICPANALELREVIIHVYHDKCSNCESCIKFCPVGALW